LHDHPQVVVSVRPAAQHVEAIIDLAGGLELDGGHGELLASRAGKIGFYIKPV
jgi:hypothetical protein